MMEDGDHPAIKVVDMSSTAALGQPKKTVTTGMTSIPVNLPPKCSSCLGPPETAVTLRREEGVGAGVATYVTGATMFGAPVRQRFYSLDVPLCKACAARYRRRGAWIAAFFALPALFLVVAMIVTQRGLYALLSLGWVAGPGIIVAVAFKLGVIRPGRLARNGAPRFNSRAYQQEYDAANPTESS